MSRLVSYLVTALVLLEDVHIGGAGDTDSEEKWVEILTNKTNITEFWFKKVGNDGQMSRYSIMTQISGCNTILGSGDITLDELEISEFDLKRILPVRVNYSTGVFEPCQDNSSKTYQEFQKLALRPPVPRLEFYERYCYITSVGFSTFTRIFNTTEDCNYINNLWFKLYGEDLSKTCTFISLSKLVALRKNEDSNTKSFYNAILKQEPAQKMIFKALSSDSISEAILNRTIPKDVLEALKTNEEKTAHETTPREVTTEETISPSWHPNQNNQTSNITEQDKMCQTAQENQCPCDCSGCDKGLFSVTTAHPTSANVTAPNGQDGSSVNTSTSTTSTKAEPQTYVTTQTTSKVTATKTYNDSVENSTEESEHPARSTTPKKDQQNAECKICNVPDTSEKPSLRLLPLWLVISAVIGLLAGFGGGVLVGLGKCRCNCCNADSESDDSVQAPPPKSVTIKTATNISDNARSRIQHLSASIYDGRFLRESTKDATSLSKPLSIHTTKQ